MPERSYAIRTRPIRFHRRKHVRYFLVMVRGKDTAENRDSFYSTVHGAGPDDEPDAGGGEDELEDPQAFGRPNLAEANGGCRSTRTAWSCAGRDGRKPVSIPGDCGRCWTAHAETIEVLHVLKPIGVCMAGADEFDPYKD